MNLPEVLYLSAFQRENCEVLSVSVETIITLYVYQYCDLNLKIIFLNVKEAIYSYTIPVQILNGLNISCEVSHSEHVQTQDSSYLLPAIVSDQGKTVIAGLCAVLRWAIKAHLVKFPGHYCQNLLGFRGGCLVACAESSIWTRFCEIQLPNTVKETSSKIKCGEILYEIPENLVLLEAHLEGPVRTHNILKRKLDIAKKVKQKSDLNSSSEFNTIFTLYDKNSQPVNTTDLQKEFQNMVITEKTDELCLNHRFVEGIDLTLADMIIFPCVQYLLGHLPYQARSHLKNVITWYKNMCSDVVISKTARELGITLEIIDESHKHEDIDGSIIVPDTSQISLYKSDPSHTKLKCKHQSPDKIISLLNGAEICPEYDETYCSKLEWEILPSELHPAHGDLPEKRLERKCQQLESIVTAVLKIAKDNQVIVEFCAGGGHVGLLLAHYLPNCKVILIENKESSMMRAKLRASKLNLENVFFYQCNLDYFKGSFDIGVSLHACGVATDLVIQQCIKEQASFVCCPCCYGSIQDTHLLTYPLSKRFQSTELSKKDYTLLAHFADRNEANTPTAEKGEVCMGLIDMDRVFCAKEQGYKSYLTTMQPVTCSPKHNLLIGIAPY